MLAKSWQKSLNITYQVWPIRSYLIGSFKNFLEEILTHKFFRYRSWFEVFLYLLIRDGGGDRFERMVLTHYSCCWGPL